METRPNYMGRLQCAFSLPDRVVALFDACEERHVPTFQLKEG